MISGELQDIAKEHSIAACQIWLTLEHQFIGNSETRALHLDTTFYNFIQDDLSVSDYCRKMKSMADSLGDLSCVIFDYNVILNILQVLNKQYDHLGAIITHNTPFLAFHKVRDELALVEITLGPDTAAVPLQAFYCNNTPAPPPHAQSHPLGNGGQDQG
jgi:hypothetical protein